MNPLNGGFKHKWGNYRFQHSLNYLPSCSTKGVSNNVHDGLLISLAVTCDQRRTATSGHVIHIVRQRHTSQLQEYSQASALQIYWCETEFDARWGFIVTCVESVEGTRRPFHAFAFPRFRRLQCLLLPIVRSEQTTSTTGLFTIG